MFGNRLSMRCRLLILTTAFAGCTDAMAPGETDAADAAPVAVDTGVTTPRDVYAPDVPDVTAPMDARTDTDALVSIDATVPPLDVPPVPDVIVPRDVPPPRDVAFLAPVHCGVAAPPGARHPPAVPAFTGLAMGHACPHLVPGVNTLMTAHGPRTFILVVPQTDMDAAVSSGPMPLFVGWHWLGGSANSFLQKGQVQASVNQRHFIAALPEKKGDLNLAIPGLASVHFDPVWPYLTLHTDERIEEEASFFDDMLACISAQFDVDQDCVSSAGVSAGGLWTAQLAQVRSERLANVMVLSGGVGPATTFGRMIGIDARGWTGTMHRAMPAMVLWGGTVDMCALNFNTASRNLEVAFRHEGHFMEECVHNCGHNVPPVDESVGIASLWQFALDHPYWLEAGDSPYLATGLPPEAPAWCGIGPGSATPRLGMCPPLTESCPIPAL